MTNPYLTFPMEIFPANGRRKKKSFLSQEKACGRAAGVSLWIPGRTHNAHQVVEVNKETCLISHSPRTPSLQSWGPFSGACSQCHTVIHCIESCQPQRQPLPERIFSVFSPRRKRENPGSSTSPSVHSVPVQREACSLHPSGVGTHLTAFKGDKEKMSLEKAKRFPHRNIRETFKPLQPEF